LKKLQIIFEDSDILVIDKPAGLVVNRSSSQVETLQDLVASYLSLPTTDYRLQQYKKLSAIGLQTTTADSGELNAFSQRSGIVHRIDPTSPRLRGASKLLVEGQMPNVADEFIQRAGIVHRIDKETSGLILAAKNEKSFEKLQAQFAKREVEKEYLCLCHGMIGKDRGEIAGAIGRLGSGKFGILEGGREAVTKYEVIDNFKFPISNFDKIIYGFGKKLKAFFEKEAGDYTYLRVYPKTGRTHQIRVHLKSINHPVVSDPLYLGRRLAKFDAKFCPRLFLHASRIKFTHPRDGKKVEFISSLPDDLQKVLIKLK